MWQLQLRERAVTRNCIPQCDCFSRFRRVLDELKVPGVCNILLLCSTTEVPRVAQCDFEQEWQEASSFNIPIAMAPACHAFIAAV